MKVGIVIPILNQFQLAVEAIESIKTKHNVDIIPVLNYKTGYSLAQAWNFGIRKAANRGNQVYLIINDDIIFSPWTIDGMVEAFHDGPENAILVSAVNWRGSYNQESIRMIEKPEAHSFSDNPDFSCFMIDNFTVQQIGEFDENFTPAYFEDNDFHRRIDLLRYRGVCTTGAPFFHYGSRTQNADQYIPVVTPPAFQINQLYYAAKWGGEPGKESFVNPYNDPNCSPREWRKN